MTINSREKTAAAARRDLLLLIDLIPWDELTREERFLMDEALGRLHEIMQENDAP